MNFLKILFVEVNLGNIERFELFDHLLLRVSVAPVGVLVVVADSLLSGPHQPGVELRLRLVAEVFWQHEVLEVLVSSLPPQSLGVGVDLTQLQVARHPLPGTSVVVVMFLNINTLINSSSYAQQQGRVNNYILSFANFHFFFQLPEQLRFDRRCKGSASSSPR